MNRPDPAEKFAGIQISPISFVDEGVEAVLNTLQNRVGVNVLMLGTVSWSAQVRPVDQPRARRLARPWRARALPDAWAAPTSTPNPRFYRDTFMADYRSAIPSSRGRTSSRWSSRRPCAGHEGLRRTDGALLQVRGPRVCRGGGDPDAAAGDGSRRTGPLSGEPSTSNPGYRTWIHSMIEDQVRNHDIDGLMWCNERNSPLDTLIQGGCPGDFSAPARAEAQARGIDVEACRRACLAMYDFMQEAAAGKDFTDGAFITFLRTLLANPEFLVWEKFWLERNKDLDRELYGLVKWCKPKMPFGLNVWNRKPLQHLPPGPVAVADRRTTPTS